MDPYFSIIVTTSATRTIAKNVVKNQASQFMPGLKPIAFIV